MIEWTAHDAREEEAREEQASRQGELFEDRIEREFRAFHAVNPVVYNRIVSMARQAKAAGRKAVGIGRYFEAMRWEQYLGTIDTMGFKLNNNFRSRYVRLVERQCPDLVGMFRKRRLRARQP